MHDIEEFFFKDVICSGVLPQSQDLSGRYYPPLSSKTTPLSASTILIDPVPIAIYFIGLR